MTQSYNIPDSISSDDLQDLFDKAMEINERPSIENPSHEDLEELAHKSIDLYTEQLGGQHVCLMHKMMLHILALRMVEFHSRVSHQLAEDGDASGALAWGRDGGKFQAVLNIMSTVGCSDDDPTCTVK